MLGGWLAPSMWLARESTNAKASTRKHRHALACLRLVLQSLCAFFSPSGTLLDLSTGPFFLLAKEYYGDLVPKWLSFPSSCLNLSMRVKEVVFNSPVSCNVRAASVQVAPKSFGSFISAASYTLHL